jgi:hypothetical protein
MEWREGIGGCYDLLPFADDHVLLRFLCFMFLSFGFHRVLSMSSILRGLASTNEEAQQGKNKQGM